MHGPIYFRTLYTGIITEIISLVYTYVRLVDRSILAGHGISTGSKSEIRYRFLSIDAYGGGVLLICVHRHPERIPERRVPEVETERPGLGIFIQDCALLPLGKTSP